MSRKEAAQEMTHAQTLNAYIESTYKAVNVALNPSWPLRSPKVSFLTCSESMKSTTFKFLSPENGKLNTCLLNWTKEWNVTMSSKTLKIENKRKELFAEAAYFILQQSKVHNGAALNQPLEFQTKFVATSWKHEQIRLWKLFFSWATLQCCRWPILWKARGAARNDPPFRKSRPRWWISHWTEQTNKIPEVNGTSWCPLRKCIWNVSIIFHFPWIFWLYD